MSRLTGHGLLNEGAAFMALANGTNFRIRLGIGGTGFAVCTCGARSPELGSGSKRRAWHEDHKNLVRGYPLTDREMRAQIQDPL